MVCTDTSFAHMFGVKIVDGNKNNFIRDQNSIVLTQSLAHKLFGESSALNKTIVLRTDDSTVYHVAVCNVIKDLPGTSHLRGIDGLLPIPEGFYGNNYGVLLGPAYLRLRSNMNINAFQEKLTNTIHAKNRFIDIRLQPLGNIHTGSSDVNYDYLDYQKIDGKYINIFIIIAFAIFIIACCNFVNLTIAFAGYRGKEIAIKKIIGAGKIQIIAQVFSEVFLSVLIAILLSILLAAALLPYLNNILNRQLPVSNLYSSATIVSYIIILLVTTLLAGSYPAWLIASSKVNQVLKTKVLFTGSRTSLRNILVTGQFAIAVIFMISLIVFLKQLLFLQTKDLGYSYYQVIKIPLELPTASKLPVIRSELLKIKGVTDVTNGFMELGGNGELFGIDYVAPDGTAKHISVNFENAAPNYVSFFGMHIMKGRDFSKDNSANEYLINETFAKQIGYSNPVGKQINLSGGFPPGVIVGVVNDFNYSSLHAKIEPLIMASVRDVPYWQSQLYVKLSTAGISGTVKKIETTLNTISGDNISGFQFLDEHFKEVYQSEQQIVNMVSIIGGLAIIIASLGLLSLITFVIARRVKEISIRKILGASLRDIVGNLSAEFIGLIFIAFIIASPIAWYFMNKWLQGFAYRISIQWWMFAIAGLLVLLIAFLTISYQAIKAAIANPVKNLRTE
jgi:putative ABC transport system permease protein